MLEHLIGGYLKLLRLAALHHLCYAQLRYLILSYTRVDCLTVDLYLNLTKLSSPIAL
jgi:hypothetical protein